MTCAASQADLIEELAYNMGECGQREIFRGARGVG